MREIRYRAIADDLRRRVGEGEFAAGRTLPSESELSGSYEASRVTIRKALELLRDEGLVDARQGFGWFAAVDPLRQSLGRLGTIEAQLAASGVRSERRILDFRFVAAPPRVRQVLGTATVLEVRRLNLADGEPFARVTVWCPEDLGAHLSRADVERAPFYELLDAPLGGAVQTIGAAVVDAARRRPARGAGRLAGAALRADHLRPRRPTRAAVRARVPRPPHRVRGRPPARRAAASRRAGSAWSTRADWSTVLVVDLEHRRRPG